MDHFLEARGNDVLRHNPPIATNNITHRGSNWLWAVCALMLVSTFAFIFMTMGAAKRVRSLRFHYIAILITLFSAFAYFVMASNLGNTSVQVTYLRGGKRPGPTREIFYARWIEYFVTFSLSILAVHMLAGSTWSTRAFVVACAMFMIVCHLSGALIRNKYKWGFLAFGLLAYLLAAWRTLTAGKNADHTTAHSTAPATTTTTGRSGGIMGRFRRNDAVDSGAHADTGRGAPGGKYKMLGAYLLGVWALYPICWGLSEAGNVTSLDGECIFYGILDILTKPVFALMLIMFSKGYESRSHHGVMGDHRKTSADTALTHDTHGHTAV